MKDTVARTFRINGLSYGEFLRWDTKHVAQHHGGVPPDCGTLGGRITFTFIPVAGDDLMGVECNVCAAAGKDRLDYSHCINRRPHDPEED